MWNFTLFIVDMIVVVLFVSYTCYKAGKKEKGKFDKITFFMMAVIVISMSCIFLADRKNIPTELGMATNVNTEKWLEITGTFVIEIFAMVVSILLMQYQIQRNNEDNMKREKEKLRIQNMPILKYDINTEIKKMSDLLELIVANEENEMGNVYNLNIILENIGMNTIRNLIIDFKLPAINNSTYRLLGKNAVTPVEKCKTVELNASFHLKPSDEYYEIYLEIYYQDVLSNWYKQEVQIQYRACDNFNSDGYRGILTYAVQKEVGIKENEIEVNFI